MRARADNSVGPFHLAKHTLCTRGGDDLPRVGLGSPAAVVSPRLPPGCAWLGARGRPPSGSG
eukprot:1218544-Alexandrium_andersonii.AAC.1